MSFPTIKCDTSSMNVTMTRDIHEPCGSFDWFSNAQVCLIGIALMREDKTANQQQQFTRRAYL